LHTDPQENLFVQVVGSKAILLHPESENEQVYATEGLMNNTSQVDVETPDYEAFPKYRNAQEGSIIIVEEGDAVFIPKKTWHFVKSIQPSWSLSFWFDK
jgi:lysine-specific demethylase 8